VKYLFAKKDVGMDSVKHQVNAHVYLDGEEKTVQNVLKDLAVFTEPAPPNLLLVIVIQGLKVLSALNLFAIHHVLMEGVQ